MQGAPKVFYAHFYETSGVLAKVNGALVFCGDDDTITEVEPSDSNFLVVLGEVAVAETQAVCDRVRGGYAAVACSRRQEVA